LKLVTQENKNLPLIPLLQRGKEEGRRTAGYKLKKLGGVNEWQEIK